MTQWQQENPKSVGSLSYQRYEKYKGSTTVREAKKNGCSGTDLKHDYARGFLQILNVPPESKSEAKAEAKSDSSKKKAESGTSANGKRKTPEESTASDVKKEPALKEVKKEPAQKSSSGATVAASSKKRKGSDDIDEPPPSKEQKKEPKQSKKDTVKEEKVTKDEKDEIKQEEMAVKKEQRNLESRSHDEEEKEESSSWWILPSTLANRVCRSGEGPSVWKVKSSESTKLKLSKKDKKDKKHKKHKKHKKDKDDQSGNRSGDGSGRTSVRHTSDGASGKTKWTQARTQEMPSITDSNGFYIRVKTGKNAASQYIGVTPHRTLPDKWQATFTEESGMRLNLGSFDTEEDAARAFAAAFKDPEAARQASLKAKQPTEQASEVKEKARSTQEEERKKRLARSIRFRTKKESTAKKATPEAKQEAPKTPVQTIAQASSTAKKEAVPKTLAQTSAQAISSAKKEAAPKTLALTSAQAAPSGKKEAAPKTPAQASVQTPTSQRENASKAKPTEEKELLQQHSDPSISKEDLQRQINDLEEHQLDQVLDFLSFDANAKDGYFELDLANLPMPKLVELSRVIKSARATAKPSAPPLAKAVVAKPAAGPPHLATRVETVSAKDVQPPLQHPPPQRQPPGKATQGTKQVATAVKAGVNGVGPSAAKTPGALAAPQKKIDLGRQYSRAALEQIPHTPEVDPGAWPGDADQQIQPTVIPQAVGSQIAPSQGGWSQDTASFFGDTGHHLVGTPLGADAWLGEDGMWAVGFEPPDIAVANLQPPLIPLGNTYPPGPCNGNCGCSKAVMQRVLDMERPWRTPARTAKVQAAMQAFESHAGVFRRGKVSRMNRFEPAPPGMYEPRVKPQATPAPQPSRSLHPPAAASSSAVIVVAPDATPPLSSV